MIQVNKNGKIKIDLKKITKKQIGLLTFGATGIVFYLQELWYFYHLGYYKVFQIDNCYLHVEGSNTLYSIVGLLIVAVLLIFINYWFYITYKQKRVGVLVLTIFIEFIALFGLVAIDTNLDFPSIFTMFQEISFAEGLLLFRKIMSCVFAINIFGISSVLTDLLYIVIYIFFRKPKEKLNISDIMKIKLNGAFLCCFTLILCVTAYYVYNLGKLDANNKTDFKIVEEAFSSTGNDNFEKNYFFIEDTEEITQLFAVIYENEDIYIISPLYWESEKLSINCSIQKIITKNEISTYYCPNIKEVRKREEK